MKLFQRQSWFVRDAKTYLTLLFLVSATDVGLLNALRKPTHRDQLIGTLGAERPELLERLLALGVSVGQMRNMRTQMRFPRPISAAGRPLRKLTPIQ